MATKSSLPLEDDEDHGAGATNVRTSERESARHRVARGRESGVEAAEEVVARGRQAVTYASF
jgi:hypothetical protein